MTLDKDDADRMSEGLESRIAGGEGQILRDQADTRYSIPYAYKFYINIHREGFFECCGLRPSDFVYTGEHLVCERNLLMVACR